MSSESWHPLGSRVGVLLLGCFADRSRTPEGSAVNPCVPYRPSTHSKVQVVPIHPDGRPGSFGKVLDNNKVAAFAMWVEEW